MNSEHPKRTILHKTEVSKRTILHKIGVPKRTILHKIGVPKRTILHKIGVSKRTILHKTEVSKRTILHKIRVSKRTILHKTEVSERTILQFPTLNPKTFHNFGTCCISNQELQFPTPNLPGNNDASLCVTHKPYQNLIKMHFSANIYLYFAIQENNIIFASTAPLIKHKYSNNLLWTKLHLEFLV